MAWDNDFLIHQEQQSISYDMLHHCVLDLAATQFHFIPDKNDTATDMQPSYTYSIALLHDMSVPSYVAADKPHNIYVLCLC